VKIFILDENELSLHMALQFEMAGHSVKVFIPPTANNSNAMIGNGLINKVTNWQAEMDRADLIVLTGNSMYGALIEPYFEKGYPIIGGNKKCNALELDREVGQNLLKQYGVKTAKFETFTDYDTAIKYVKANPDKTFVSKPWGGTDDKDLSYVSKNAADMTFMLEHWKSEGKLKKGFMLQEKIDGYEMAVGGWFGKHGWCQAINENWEEKRLMNDGLGENTGEMGTIMRYVTSSKLFDETLEPVTDYLLAHGYIGYVDMNCIVKKDGTPAPLEFTTRFGWPHVNIAMQLHRGDFAQSLADLLQGKDTMRVNYDTVSCGVVMLRPAKVKIHEMKAPPPIYNLTARMLDNVCLQKVCRTKAPMMLNGQVQSVSTLCAVGEYIAVVADTGDTVKEASEAAYKTCWKLNWPGNRGFRTDIGKHLKKHLPLLQEHGYALGMEYE